MHASFRCISRCGTAEIVARARFNTHKVTTVESHRHEFRTSLARGGPSIFHDVRDDPRYAGRDGAS